jgi:hypothetical protein
MKAIFAVTALAAAISGQALAADTETTTTFSGAIDAQFIYNMAGATEDGTVLDSTYDVNLDDDDDGTDGLYGLTMEMAVTNGPLSALITTELDEEVSGISIGDIIVTEGKLSFGQVGEITSTDEYVSASVEMEDGDDVEDEIGFRYAVADGITVQLGGTETPSTPLTGVLEANATHVVASAQYMGASGPLAYVVEGQMKSEALDAENSVDAQTFIGAGLTYSTDMLTVMAAVNMTSFEGVSDTEYAVEAVAKVAGATLTGAYLELSTETDDDEEMFGGVSYAIDAITLSAGYLMTTAESAGDEVTAGLGYSAGMMSYSADITLANFDADTADAILIELGASTVSAAGVTYYGEFEMQAEGDAGAATTAETSKLTVGGKYSF